MPTPKTETPLSQAIEILKNEHSNECHFLSEVDKNNETSIEKKEMLEKLILKLQSILPSEKEGLIEAYRDGWQAMMDITGVPAKQWHQNKYSDGKQD